MSLQYLVSAVSSFIIATSLRIPRDFSEIEIRHGELIPAPGADVLEGSTVKGTCGSLQPVTWTYTINFNEEFGYNFEIVDGIYVYLGNNDPLPGTNIQHNNTIILTNLRVSDSGYYHCFGTYRTYFGMIDYFQMSFNVHVHTAAPFGYVLPSVTHVSEGDNISFVCGSSRGVEWFFRPIGQEVHLANNTLLLHNVRKNSSGLYFCRGFHRNRTIFQIPAVLFVDTRVVFMQTVTFESQHIHFDSDDSSFEHE